MELLFPLLILFMIGLLFMSNRQRRKQESKQTALQNSIDVGDVVVMTSGISGTVVDNDDERTIDLEIAPDVVTTWLRAAVREKLVPESDDAIDGDDDPAGDDAPQSSITTAATPAVTDAPATNGDKAPDSTSTDGSVSSPRTS